MTLLLDQSSGSIDLAMVEPVRSMLDVCDQCHGVGVALGFEGYAENGERCEPCLGTGRVLSCLGSADIAFPGKGPSGSLLVGIEAKRLDDLIRSMRNGRLQGTQIPRMLDEYDEKWLLAYGRYRPNPDTGVLQEGRLVKSQGQPDRRDPNAEVTYWRDYQYNGSRPILYSYVEGFLSSPSLTRLGVNVKRVSTIEEAAAWIAVLYTSWQKEWDEHSSFDTFDRSRESGLANAAPMGLAADEKALLRAKLAIQFDGIGWPTAWAVASHFKSAREMFAAGPDEWESVKYRTKKGKGKERRLGPKLAKLIDKWIS